MEQLLKLSIHDRGGFSLRYAGDSLKGMHAVFYRIELLLYVVAILESP